MNKNLKILFISIFIVFSSNTFAVDTLNSILNNYYTASSTWVTTLQPIAIKLYWFWFTAELLYQITFKKVLANDMQKLWYFLTIRVFTGYMFATIFVDPAFYSGIITYFVNLGGQAGHFNINPSSGNPFGDMSPSSVLDIGSTLWNQNWSFVSAIPTAYLITMGLPFVLLSAGVYILMAIMAFTLFMTALEAYIVMNAGIILCGFAGSSWTQGFWNKYLSYVGGIAIRLFVMCLILGLIYRQVLENQVQIGLTGAAFVKNPIDATQAAFIGAVIKTFIDMLVCAFLVVKVPAMAGSMLTGTVNSGMGDVIQGAAMMLAGAGLAKGLAKMGINMAGGSGGGENSAKEKFKDSLRGSGGGGLPSGGSKGGSTGATKTDSQTAKSAMSPKDKAKAMADLCGVSTEPAGGSGGGDSASGGGGGSGDGSSSGSGGESSGGGSGTSGSSAGSGGGSSSGSSTSSGNSEPTNNSQSSGSSNSNSSGSSSSETGSPSSNSTSSGGMSGNSGSGSSGNKPASKPITKDEAARKEKNAKIIQDMIKNKDSLIKSAKQMASGGGHAGAADLNINPHKHE